MRHSIRLVAAKPGSGNTTTIAVSPDWMGHMVVVRASDFLSTEHLTLVLPPVDTCRDQKIEFLIEGPVTASNNVTGTLTVRTSNSEDLVGCITVGQLEFAAGYANLAPPVRPLTLFGSVTQVSGASTLPYGSNFTCLCTGSSWRIDGMFVQSDNTSAIAFA